jgi:2-dehydropantoate 2-reductase
MAGEPKIAVIGVGPVGGILLAHLAHAGHWVVSCDIQTPHLDAIREKGLSVTGVAELLAKCERIACGVSGLSNFPEIDTVVIATKASVLPQLVPQIAAIARPEMRFITCQNGLDNEEYLAETFGPDNVLRLIINYGGSQMGDGIVHMSFFNPPNYIGAMTPNGELLARTLAGMLTDAGLETQFTADIKRYEWEKVVLNSALNPICALTRKPMKDMMDLELTELLAAELLREGIAVANAAGITFDDDFLEHGLQYLRKAGYHRTSMHQDVLRHVPTEIHWINCKIVEWGRAHNVRTPYNFTIAALIQGLEMESGAPEEH